jgi:excinuclease ABC subunit B
VIQLAYNEEHGIIPQTIIKSITEIERSTRVADARTRDREEEALAKVAERRAAYGGEAPKKDPRELIAELEQEMKDAAAQLDFERAALLRDELLELRASLDGAKPRPGARARSTGTLASLRHG